MPTEYAFALRYRADDEPRGLGRLLIGFEAFDLHVQAATLRLMREIGRTHPGHEFDGLVMQGTRET